MQNDTEAYDRLHAEFGEAVSRGPEDDDRAEASEPWIAVEPARLADVAKFLRDAPELAYDYLNDLSVVDYLPVDMKLAKAVGDERLEVVYHLSSLARRVSLTLKVTLPRWVDGELPEVPSVAGLWATADWQECEAYDLSGVRFTGHPNLRRLLCPDDWEGHPLRKDYEQPLEYHGIRGR